MRALVLTGKSSREPLGAIVQRDPFVTKSTAEGYVARLRLINVSLATLEELYAAHAEKRTP